MWGFHKVLEANETELKEKYLSNSCRHHLLDRLHSLHQGNMSVQDYAIEFDDLTLCCEVQEDSYQAISRYHFGLRSDFLRAMFIHSHKLETLELTSQLAQNIETFLRFSSEHKIIFKATEQLSINTYAPRDHKVKCVIGESSKNAKSSQYFKCQGYGHIIA